MSAFNITVEGGKTVRLPTAGKYCDRDIIVTANGGDSMGAWKFIVDEHYPCDHLSIVNGVLYCTDEWKHYVCKDAMGDVGYADSETPFDLSVLDKGKTYYIVDGDVGENRGTLVFDVNASYDVVRNQDRLITENGVYRSDNGYTGLGTVTVNVPQTGGGENKFVQLIDKTVTEITAEDLQGVTKIGTYAFRSCSNLSNVELPTGIKSIGSYAFAYCAALEEIVLPNGVETIGASVFDNCSSVKTIDLPESLLSIGGGAMVNACSSLEKIIVRATTPPTIQSTTLNNFSSRIKIVVPIGCGETYENATNWSVKASQIEEEEGGGGEEQWLFQDEYINGERTDLTAPDVGVSYTLFVNGEEIGTEVCSPDPFEPLRFSTEDLSIIFVYSSEGCRWRFDDSLSEILSGTVSIRING